MIEVPGYILLEKLHKSYKTLVYRAIRTIDSQNVILKVLITDTIENREITRLEREFNIIRSLDMEEVARAYSIEKYQNLSVLVLEDIGGQSLSRYLFQNQFNLGLFLSIASRLAGIVEKIHKKSIIHKDLKPENIIYNKENNTLKIIDFSVSSEFPKESVTKRIFSELEGTLTYSSPEQTGWMNRLIDYRTDFYTLGITFYRMFTGSLPFDSEDPLELIHSHIAREPVPPNEINNDIPETLSLIILKLLSKNPEDRYKTAGGLKYDLDKCLNEFQEKGSVSDFQPGAYDISDKFHIPETLFGRQEQIKSLQEAYRRISINNSELIFIAGQPGVGKSVLVRQMYKPVVQNSGFFISGKFEQFNKDQPYNAFTQAFEDLINQILTRSPDKVNAWKENLVKSLGENISVITSIVPKLELITGQSTLNLNLSALELQNRFHLIVLNFLRIIATAENPVVLFIDDLQWADSSSLKLIENLLTNSEFNHILFLCAYREEELKNNILLQRTIDSIVTFRENHFKQSGQYLFVDTIELENLDNDAISELIKETLNCKKSDASVLAEIVSAQTAGNPFFVNQFLSAIYQEGLFEFDLNSKKWKWDISSIKRKGFTDNVIKLMADNFQRKPDSSYEILQTASCIGSQFDIETLSYLTGKSWERVNKELADAIRDEYIYTVDEGSGDIKNFRFKFQHDQIMLAANSLLDRHENSVIHQKIGDYLLNKIPFGKHELFSSENTDRLTAIGNYADSEENLDELLQWCKEYIFNLVNHFNSGIDQITETGQITGIVVLNLVAAMESRKNAGFASALSYLNFAIKLLDQDPWQKHYFLALHIFTETAECEYIHTNFSEAERYCQLVMENAKELIDKIRIFNITIASLTPQNKFMEAIKAGRNALLELGINLPEKPTPTTPLPDILFALVKLSRKINKLSTLEPMKDPRHLAAMNLLVQLITPSFIAVPDLFPVLVLKMVHLTLKHGLSPQTAPAFAFFCMILGSALGKYEMAENLSDEVLKIMTIIPSDAYSCKVHFVLGNMVKHWKKPLSESQFMIESGYHKGLSTGDLLFASYSLNWFNAYNYLMRKNLQDTLQDMIHFKISHDKIKQKDAVEFYDLWTQFVATLAENSPLTGKINGQYFNEKASVKIWIETNNDTDLFVYYMMKGILHYFKKDFQNAVMYLEKALPHGTGVFGMPVTVEHNFFYSLALLGSMSVSGNTGKSLKQVEKNQKKLKLWGENSPHNYYHKFLIIEAEILSQKNEKHAIDLFGKAIKQAFQDNFILEQALANELLGNYYSKIKNHFISNAYILEANKLYTQWGAFSKILKIEEDFPELISSRTPWGSKSLTRSGESIETNTHQTIDLNTVLKVSQNISSEIDLDKLTQKLVAIAIENAGADRGFLILNRNDHLYIMAEGEKGTVVLHNNLKVENSNKLSLGVLNYSKQTSEVVVINDTSSTNQFQSDPYIIQQKPKSILCLPVLKPSSLIGILYLENTLLTNVFTNERLDMLKLLSSQAIISLENALYVKKIVSINNDLEDEIEQHKKTEEELILTKERYALAARGANDGLWDWDLLNEKIYYSPRWKDMLGYTEGEIENSPEEWYSRVHPEDLVMLQTAINSHLEGILPHLECEYRMKHKDGGYLWMITRGLAVKNENAPPYRMAGSQTEITKRKLAEEQLKHDALFDSLTDLPNWNLLLDRMDHAIKRKIRQPDYMFAILFIDIDRFKVINDSLGHEVGNKLLKELSLKLETCLRPEDTIARLGGDEFVILLESIDDISEPIQVINRLKDGVSKPFNILHHELFVTLSIGVVINTGDYVKPQDIIRDADTAMHRAKTQGRNRYEIFDKTMHANITSYLKIEGEIRRALDKHEFRLYYQPIVSVKSGEICGAEALIRWEKENGEIISPPKFIPLAEESGLILPIGNWVLEEACSQMKKWEKDGHHLIEISINISGRQFSQKNFMDTCDKCLEKTRINPELLQFEITESVVMENIDNTVTILNELKSRGIKVAIDDFGTGYSSLSYLKQFPVQKLKIDKSFVTNMVTEKNDEALVKAIIAMSESLNMKTIAEGVETREQLDMLRRHNCDEIQGYYFSRPIPADEFSELLQKQKSYKI